MEYYSKQLVGELVSWEFLCAHNQEKELYMYLMMILKGLILNCHMTVHF